MGREVPGYVDVFLKQAKVEASRIDIPDITDIARLNNIDDLAHDGEKKKRMADHQHETFTSRDIHQLLTLRRARCHRLFDECVLSRKEARLSKRKMMLNGRGDDNGV